MNTHRALFTCSLMVLLATPVLADWDDGVAAFRAGRYQDATAVFQSFVSSNPKAPEGHYMLGLSLLSQKRPEEATAPLGKALSLGEDDVRYRMTLAQALLKAGKTGEAFDTLEAQDAKTVANASRASFNQLLAKAALSSGRNAAAFTSLEKAIAADKNSKVLWLARANLAGRLDRLEDAFTALVTASEIDKGDPEPSRGAVHTALKIAQDPTTGERKLEWYVNAADVANRLATAFPTPENQRLAGAANMGARKYDRAIGYFESLQASDDQNPQLHYDLGRCQQARGQHREALDHFATALERSPDAKLTTNIHAKRGMALQALEDLTGAAAAYRLAGNTDAAKEMDGYVQNRREWEAEKKECAVKREALQGLLASSEGLEHTREYQEVQQDLATIRSVCEPYFNEQG